ncbi:MAG: UPF0236 family protein [Peptococcaceae bacterium MAG4]|nr:UPF0236 family protein [Peptococcaceae bacterium MAG4]
MEERDKERYETRGIRSRQIETLFGTLEYKRRYYLDVKTGTYVCLLDQALGIEKKIKVSPGLSELAVYKGVKGASYREAQEQLESFYQRPVISHETIRQRVLDTGELIFREERCRQEHPCRRTPGADIISRSRWHMGKSAAGVKKQSRKAYNNQP